MEQTEAGDVRYNLVTYSYDDMGNRISVKRYLDYQSVDSAKGRCHEIRYKYDRSDRIIEVWERMEESAKAKYVTGYSKAIYKYDENDNVVSITMPDGGVITYEHDADDHVVKERHKDATGIGCTIEYEYDNAGNVTVKRTEGVEERYSYDYMNREIRYIDGEGGITTRSYDLNGRMKKFIDPNENAKVIANAAYNAHGYTYSYDAEDRLLSIVGPDGFAIESNIYDLSGNLSVKVDAEGNQVRFDYDLAGRNIKITSPGGSIQKFSYDAVGNIESSTDGCGETTRFTNDAWGRATEIIRADEAVERYEYDFAGNIIKATDAEGNTVNYSFGERNLLVSRTDVFGETEKFCYDKTGNLASHTDRNGNKITYEYNMYRSPVSRTARADGLDSIVEQYSYDKIGRLISAISDGRRYDYRYDNSNRIIEKSVGGRNLVSYTYDANGNITTLTDVTGKRTRYEYDFLGRTMSVKDEASDFFALYEYTKNGNVKSVSTPVIKSKYEYDADGKMTSLFTATSGLDIEKILANNTYRYDKNGNRTEKTTLAGTTKYKYDVLGQLISETSSNVNNVYSYDKAGNRTALQGGDIHEVYIYDRGRLSGRTIHNSKGIATYNYTYDAQGNTLSDGENTYLYDCLNRISQVTTKAGDIQKNHYDVEGLRDQMEENGNLVRFIYSGREVIVEEDAAGERIRYIRGHELLATDSESARTYYHYACDEMGSITHLTDEDGNVLNHYEYDAFGNQVVAEESVKNRFGFAGEIRDALTGQYYLRARFYNPVIARFISEDTYYGDGLNLYVYCHNNPVGYVDPSGHLCKEKYNAIESLRDRDGSNAGDALKKYKELRKEGYTPEQIKNGDYRKRGGNLLEYNLQFFASKSGSDTTSTQLSRRELAEKKLADAATGSRAEGVLIGKDGDVPVYKSQQQLRKSITDAGAQYIGPTRNNDGQIYHMNTPYGPVEIRIMQQKPGQTNPYLDNRTIIVEQGSVGNGTGVYTYGNGAPIKGAVSKSDRKAIGHTHGQIP